MFNHTEQSAGKADVCKILPTKSRTEDVPGLAVMRPPEIGRISVDVLAA